MGVVLGVLVTGAWRSCCNISVAIVEASRDDSEDRRDQAPTRP